MESIEVNNFDPIKIIKYLNHQKYSINNDIFLDICLECGIVENNSNFTINNNYKIKKPRINKSYLKKICNIFKDVCDKYYYYVFIIDILPDILLRNILRKFNYDWIFKIPNISISIDKINETNKPKLLLLKELDLLKKKNPEFILFFIQTLESYFNI